MAKSIAPEVLVALKEALAKIYWYKKDLKAFLSSSIKNDTIISTIGWEDNNKYESVSQLIDRMNRRPDIYLNDLMALIYSVCNFNTFDHFDRLPDKDGNKLKADAESTVKVLRKSCQGYFEMIEADRLAKENRKKYDEKLRHTQDYNNKLNSFRESYYSLSKMGSLQQRGYMFENFLNDLFVFFDLSPRSSFKISGEQIDGAFTHDNNDYLLEAKWQTMPINRSEIDVFEAKISRKLKTALGLFISVNGFAESVASNVGTYKSAILMDSQDLIQVLENRITLPELILHKRRHAAETGEIMFRVNA